MNNYIVDPMFFYWCKVVDHAYYICAIGFVAMAVCLLGFIIFNTVENYEYDSMFEIPKFKKRFVILLVLAIVFALGAVFIPTKETLIEMEIAKHATYDNLEITIQKIIDAASKIFDSK